MSLPKMPKVLNVTDILNISNGLGFYQNISFNVNVRKMLGKCSFNVRKICQPLMQPKNSEQKFKGTGFDRVVSV